jgi:cell division protease FtsH
VCVWAATNYAERIDPALVRPGRLDRIIHFAARGAPTVLDGRRDLGRASTETELADAG